MTGQQTSGASTITVSTSNVQILPSRVGNRLKRTQLIITPITAGSFLTVVKGDNPAVANNGIILQGTSFQSYLEASDGGYTCHQGAVQAIANQSTTVTITETFEEK